MKSSPVQTQLLMQLYSIQNVGTGPALMNFLFILLGLFRGLLRTGLYGIISD